MQTVGVGFVYFSRVSFVSLVYVGLLQALPMASVKLEGTVLIRP